MSAEIKYKEIYGITLLFVTLLGGASFYVVKDPSRSYGVCREGWELEEDGTFSCSARGIYGEYCSRLTKTRCYYGKIISASSLANPITYRCIRGWKSGEIGNAC